MDIDVKKDEGKCDHSNTVEAGEIKVICCYCQKAMETKKGRGVTGISHGICYDCFIKTRDAWRAEIEAYKKKWVDAKPEDVREET